MKAPCVICQKRPRQGWLFCVQCGMDYNRRALEECDVGSTIEWAAKRARWFERRRSATGERE